MLDLYCKNCLAAYAACVLQRFKKCVAQTFFFLFKNPQNNIYAAIVLLTLYERTAFVLQNLHHLDTGTAFVLMELTKNYNSSVPQLIECVYVFFSNKYICELKTFCRDNSMNYNY